MPRQSISLTEPNAAWVKAQIDSQEYTSMSDALNDLIRQARRQEGDRVDAVRAMLIEAEQSLGEHGYSQKSLHGIWDLAKQKYIAEYGSI